MFNAYKKNPVSVSVFFPLSAFIKATTTAIA